MHEKQRKHSYRRVVCKKAARYNENNRVSKYYAPNKIMCIFAREFVNQMKKCDGEGKLTLIFHCLVFNYGRLPNMLY